MSPVFNPSVLGQAKNLARAYLEGGTGADSTYARLRELGFDVRREDIRQYSRSILSEGINNVLVARYHQTGAIPSDLVNVHAPNQRDPWNYDFVLRGYDAESGTIRIKYMTITSDVRLTADQAFDTLIDRFGDAPERYGMTVTSLSLTSVSKREDAAW